MVSATRSDAAASTLGDAVSVLDRERIDERAASSTLALLQDLPGIATARTGAVGAQGSVFVRGGESRFARVLVDGVPVNQPGGAYDFGSARAARVRAHRGRARRGQQPLRHRRAGRRRALRQPPRRRRRLSLRLEGEGGEQRVVARPGGDLGPRGRARLERRACSGCTTDNDAPNTAFEQTAGAAQPGSAPWARAGTLRCWSRAPRRASRARPARPRSAGRTSTRPSSATTGRGGASFRWAGDADQPRAAGGPRADAPALAEPAGLRARSRRRSAA